MNIFGIFQLDKQLSVSWNDAFRRIFHFHRWEAVKELICFCEELDFMHMYNLCRWKFLNNVNFWGLRWLANL